MISERHKFIYLHVPKTAGNSIQSLLLPFSDDIITLNEYQDGIDRFGIKGAVTPFKHATISDYFKVLGDAIRDYKIIISVRHPLSRALSYYHMPRRWMDLEKNISIPIWDSDEFINLLPTIKPASEFLFLNNEYIEPDHVIHLETLDQDFTHFCQQCEIDLQGKRIPERNKSSFASNFSQEFDITPKVQTAVNIRFRKDYLMFNYY